jgi:hypothetical protein
MPTIEEPFSQQKIDNLYQYLQSSKEQGEPDDFEIFVDNFKVIKRTNDLTRFENYTDFIVPQTESITILIYDGTSPRNTKHKFIKNNKQELSGLDINNRIDERIKTEKDKWENDLLRKEYEQVKTDLETAEGYIEELEDKLELIRDTKPRVGEMNLGELASVMLEGFVRRNPQMLTKLPGVGEALAGAFIEDNAEKEKLLLQAPEPEPKASFKMKGEDNTPDTLSEEDRASLGFIKQLNTVFSREQMTQIMLILDILAKQPENINKTIQFLSELHK